MIRRRIASFDSKLVIDQHEKFFRKEYYKAAFTGQPVSRYNAETEELEPEDLCKDFTDYLAITLQIAELG